MASRSHLHAVARSARAQARSSSARGLARPEVHLVERHVLEYVCLAEAPKRHTGVADGRDRAANLDVVGS